MKILALEFSSSQRSVAVVRGIGSGRAASGDSFSTHGPPSTPEGTNRDAAWEASEIVEMGALGANAIGMIDRALRQAQVEREQIECLAIGLGPGSYNGVRLAIAAAQGWQLASSQDRIKLLGISSAECLAAEGREEGLAGRVNVLIDAQRGEFYLAGYYLSAAGCSQIEPLRVATLQELQQREMAGERFIGPDVAARLRGGRRVFPRATTLGRLALGRNDFVAGQKLEPIYLRETSFVKAPPPRLLLP